MLKSVRRQFLPDLTLTAAVASEGAIFASCAENQFSVFEAASLKKTTFAVENSSRCVAVDNARTQPHIFMSCDFDGTVKLWDLRLKSRLTDTSQAGRDFLPKGAFFGAAAISPDGLRVAAGTCGIRTSRKNKSKTKKKSRGGLSEAKRSRLETDADGSSGSEDDDSDVLSAFLVSWDTRMLGKEPLFKFADLHTDDINCVTFDPNNPNRMLSCADDGLICLSDLIAPEDDRLLEVFNAEHQANCCGFLDPTNSCPSVYAFDSMRTHFNAWPLNTTASDETVEEPSPAWRQLKTPKRARALLAARLIDPSPLRVCLLSSWAVKADVRLSLVTPTKADVVKNRHLIKRAREVAPDLECDAVYARFMGVGVQDKEGKQKLDVVVVGRHSVNRFQARV